MCLFCPLQQGYSSLLCCIVSGVDPARWTKGFSNIIWHWLHFFTSLFLWLIKNVTVSYLHFTLHWNSFSGSTYPYNSLKTCCWLPLILFTSIRILWTVDWTQLVFFFAIWKYFTFRLSHLLSEIIFNLEFILSRLALNNILNCILCGLWNHTYVILVAYIITNFLS